MIKLIVGKKGMGKTKTLIDLVNKAVENHSGNVVCIEKGVKLTYDVSHKARLIDASQYAVKDYDTLYGFICGIFASNYDVTSIFIDSITKICEDDISGFGAFLQKLDITRGDTEVTITVSASEDELSDDVKKFLK